MRSVGWLVAVLLAAITGSLSAPAGPPQATVLRWIDGDTVRAAVGASVVRIRLIGIDAPETSAGERAWRQGAELKHDVATVVALGQLAKAAAERLAPAGAAVQVELDVQTHDRYGRLLAYLWRRDGRMVNEELVRAGYAMVLTIPPNVKYADRFLRAQREARTAGRGLWKPSEGHP
ncbi:MAG TPA: thermonuclease family protein [bacterium]|nr:thermonuclease family protein [bacterium]